jgi:hypothetical protein
MRILFRRLRVLLLIALTFLSSSCDEDANPTQSLPTGCQAQGVHALAVLESQLTCGPTNAFKNLDEVLGPPDGRSTGDGKLELDGFVSLGVEGSVTLFMGSCIQDLTGADIRVYQTVASEAVEVLISANPDGPFTSLGTLPCDVSCDFDMAGSGLNNIRVVQVVDRARTQFLGAECDNVGPSPGADLDAVEVLH